MKLNFPGTVVLTIFFIHINLLTMAQTSTLKSGNGQKIFSEVAAKEPTRESLKPENDPRIFSEVRSFLKQLNSENGKPIEQLSPAAARQVLIDAQNSVTVDYSGIEESERTITQDGEQVKIHITKPIGVGANAPVFIFVHGGGWVLGDYPTHRR